MKNNFISFKATVYPWYCDHMNHMNVRWYIDMFDEATWQILNEYCITNESMKNNNSLMAAVRQEIEYKRELFPGNGIYITSSLQEIKSKGIKILHEMKNQINNVVVATMISTIVYVDTNPKKPSPIPEDILSKCREFSVTSINPI